MARKRGLSDVNFDDWFNKQASVRPVDDLSISDDLERD